MQTNIFMFFHIFHYNNYVKSDRVHIPLIFHELYETIEYMETQISMEKYKEKFILITGYE